MSQQKKRFCLIASAVGAALSLAACTNEVTTGPGEEYFGDAVRHNIAVQTVNPDPHYAAGPPPYDGNRVANAMRRYQTDKVKQPRDLRTSDVSILSAGSGGQ